MHNLSAVHGDPALTLTHSPAHWKPRLSAAYISSDRECCLFASDLAFLCSCFPQRNASFHEFFRRINGERIFVNIFFSVVKGRPYSITERKVPELIPVLGSQPTGDASHKTGGSLPLLSARPAVTPPPPATLKRAATNFAAW